MENEGFWAGHENMVLGSVVGLLVGMLAAMFISKIWGRVTLQDYEDAKKDATQRVINQTGRD